MKLYQIYTKQALSISKEKAWDFLSKPENLGVITPKHMSFNIQTEDIGEMYAGQIIQYKISPFKGYATKWVTEITHVQEGVYFVDEQRFGPYSLWHHKHFIKEEKGYLIMEDIVDYKLPLGILGRLAHELFVKRQLKTIFTYRAQKLIELFGKVDGVDNELIMKSI